MKPPEAFSAPLDAASLRSRFERAESPGFGLEEEVFLVDRETFDLDHSAAELLAGLDLGEAVKLELPACQLEIVTPPRSTIAEAVTELGATRSRLLHALDGGTAVLASGTHPFAAPEAPLNRGSHYERVAGEYGAVARRQLVCGMHVHVALPGSERVLPVYNALRGYLPLIAALAANAPLHEGRDSGLASVRPLISGLLPRQGIPPPLESWEQLAGDLAWGRATGRLDGVVGWWWELRLHASLGTIEVRVPDAQTRLDEAAAVAGLSAALVLWLAERHDAGDLEPPARSWRIAENRWSAARDGTRGAMYDLRSGERREAGELLAELLAELRRAAQAAGAEEELARAERMLDANGAARQRAILKTTGDPAAVVAQLAGRYVEPDHASSPSAASIPR